MVPSVGMRLNKAFNRDAFWNQEQKASFLAACSKSGVSPGPLEAFHWKRGNGKPQEYWQGLTKGQRKQVKREVFETARAA